jgi:hypothetical protein
MAITLDGTTGITTPGLTNTGTETIVNLTTTGNTILGDASTDTLNVGNGGLIKDASGNVGVGVTPFANTGKLAVKGNISLTDGTVQGTSTEAVQTTPTITTAKTILASVAPALSSASAAAIYVYGSNNGGAYFFDKLVCIANAAAPVVLTSTTLGGAPAARTYALSGGALTLAMASGTYSVTAKTVALGFPF